MIRGEVLNQVSKNTIAKLRNQGCETGKTTPSSIHLPTNILVTDNLKDLPNNIAKKVITIY